MGMISDIIASAIAVILGIIKCILFLYHRKQFVQLIYRIRGIFKKEIEICPEAATIVDAEIRSDQLLSFTYMRWFNTFVILSLIKPIVIMVMTRLRTGLVHLELPYSGAYPWSYQSVLAYIPTCIWNVLAGYGTMCMTVAMDTLLFAFSFQVCALFKIAQHRIRQLVPQTDAPQQELREMKQVLHLHQTALMIATQLGNDLRPIVLMQFFTNVLQLSFVTYQVANLFPSPDGISFMFFLGSVLIAVFIYSHCGENIQQASEDFATAAYDSNWVDFAPATRHALILSIRRAQLPCQLDGYFFKPNMATFSAVVRSAMSYLMMLRSFMDQ
ncbi:odorant receptor 9a [Drosophila grimshawi]|nr:odorant receptor 9a [Drosophila grimshawi]